MRHFAISPDVNVKNISDWFIFNTKIQRMTGEDFHATPYDDFADLRAAFEANKADLIYANAADAAELIRDRGYLPVAASQGVSNEATVVVAAESPFTSLSDLPGSLTAAATDAPDVERICRILLEPADLGPDTISLTRKRNAVTVAKAVVTGEAQVGFLGTEALEEMSGVTRSMLRPLISSHIYVVRHSMLASPQIAEHVPAIRRGLGELSNDPAQKDLLAALGAPKGWQDFDDEDAAFMIDLMDALAQ